VPWCMCASFRGLGGREGVSVCSGGIFHVSDSSKWVVEAFIATGGKE